MTQPSRSTQGYVVSGTVRLPDPAGQLAIGDGFAVEVRRSDGVIVMAYGLVVDLEPGFAVVDFDSRKQPPA